MTIIKHTVDRAGTHAILAQTDKRRYHATGATQKAAQASVEREARIMGDKV